MQNETQNNDQVDVVITWVRDSHDKQKLRAYVGERQMGSIWKIYGKWSSLIGNCHPTQTLAKKEIEDQIKWRLETEAQEEKSRATAFV